LNRMLDRWSVGGLFGWFWESPEDITIVLPHFGDSIGNQNANFPHVFLIRSASMCIVGTANHKFPNRSRLRTCPPTKKKLR
jgi:hypothetical protein